MNKNTLREFNRLLKKGDIVICPQCDSYNAYAWEDCNVDSNTGLRLVPSDGYKDGGELYTTDEYLPSWPDVYHIPSASGFEWQCGKCKTYLMPVNSPLNHPCYTHEDLRVNWSEIAAARGWKYLTSKRAKLLMKGL